MAYIYPIIFLLLFLCFEQSSADVVWKQDDVFSYKQKTEARYKLVTHQKTRLDSLIYKISCEFTYNFKVVSVDGFGNAVIDLKVSPIIKKQEGIAPFSVNTLTKELQTEDYREAAYREFERQTMQMKVSYRGEVVSIFNMEAVCGDIARSLPERFTHDLQLVDLRKSLRDIFNDINMRSQLYQIFMPAGLESDVKGERFAYIEGLQVLVEQIKFKKDLTQSNAVIWTSEIKINEPIYLARGLRLTKGGLEGSGRVLFDSKTMRIKSHIFERTIKAKGTLIQTDIDFTGYIKTEISSN